MVLLQNSGMTLGFGNTSLKNQFPRLYCLALNRDIMVRDCWNHGWKFTWSRNISSGTNANQLATLHKLLSEISLNDSADFWAWYIETPEFTVKSARKHIDNNFLPGGGLATRTLRDRLPSRWNLSRKETSHHTLWTCSLATTVWNRVLNWLDLSPPIISDIQDLYAWLDDLHISSKKKDTLEVICGVVLWSMWNYRNETIFGTALPKRSLLFDKIVDCSFRWLGIERKRATNSSGKTRYMQQERIYHKAFLILESLKIYISLSLTDFNKDLMRFW
ncbi:RNA-directed DNA polymerase, eukaryota, Reverse transcriptase zinc-binding domain protein [Artemisia annua]|uniref:RNA-directed DNA polymerase, eukaryota, Reverse transcriptase zinc-binding domain protein n=1 Tax=Artemisia annua TaxID=35608 RepID=A0A2U1N4U9_ARTAN|nr:RNA-directed DNA polymerase, eukaryota, Reverse transcriptase zinc-binding domain protein [Artemisia annua]